MSDISAMLEEDREEEADEEIEEGNDDQTNVFTGWFSSTVEIEYTFLESKTFANDGVVICGILRPTVIKANITRNTYKFNVTIFIS